MELEILATANVFILALGGVAVMASRSDAGFYARAFVIAGLTVCTEAVAWRAFTAVGGGTAAHLILASASAPLAWAFWHLVNTSSDLLRMARRLDK